MRKVVAALMAFTVAGLFAVTADASPEEFKLGGRAVNTLKDEPVAGMTILIFTKKAGDQDQLKVPIAHGVTEPNGRFQILVPRTVPLPLVRIVIVPPNGLACENVALVGVVGAAVAYGARRETPNFSARPSGTQLNQNNSYSTFEMVGTVGLDGSCTGDVGLFRAKEQE